MIKMRKNYPTLVSLPNNTIFKGYVLTVVVLRTIRMSGYRKHPHLGLQKTIETDLLSCRAELLAQCQFLDVSGAWDQPDRVQVAHFELSHG